MERRLDPPGPIARLIDMGIEADPSEAGAFDAALAGLPHAGVAIVEGRLCLIAQEPAPSPAVRARMRAALVGERARQARSAVVSVPEVRASVREPIFPPEGVR